jgi:hypothetical protein
LSHNELGPTLPEAWGDPINGTREQNGNSLHPLLSSSLCLLKKEDSFFEGRLQAAI